MQNEFWANNREQLFKKICNNDGKDDEEYKLLFEQYGQDAIKTIMVVKIQESARYEYINAKEIEINELYKRFNIGHPYLFIPRFFIAEAHGNFKEVKELYRKEYKNAIMSDNDRVMVLKSMAETYIKDGNLDKALELLKEADSLCSNEKLTQALKLSMLKILKDWRNKPEIEKICDELMVRFSRENLSITRECAIYYLFIGKYDESEQILIKNLILSILFKRKGNTECSPSSVSSLCKARSLL